MYGMQTLISTLSLALLFLVNPQKAPAPTEPPCSWGAKEIGKQAPPYGVKGRVYVLAWKFMEDERPLRVDSLLVLKVLEKNEGYHLTHLYRHPDDKKPEWRLSTTHVSGKQGTKYYPGLMLFHHKAFEKKPGNKELYAALSPEEIDWAFELEEGWKCVSCGVCEKNWEEAIGEKPTRFFGR
jgi:hypothetical protein